MPRYAVLLAYDGTAFAGWWRQPDARTVGGVLDAAFARLGEPTAHALGASRTDAGVHAREQVAHVDCARPWAADDLARALSSQLPPDVACRAVAAVVDDWHAVHLASGKTYRYRLDVGAVVDPFLAPRISWRPPFSQALATLEAALQATATPLIGAQDLRAFARRGEHREDLRTTLTAVAWYRRERFLIARIRGDRFSYRIVRSLVGGMVATATGTTSTAQWRAALAGEVTPAAQQQAPACGLCLEHVHYDTPPRWQFHR